VGRLASQAVRVLPNSFELQTNPHQGDSGASGSGLWGMAESSSQMRNLGSVGRDDEPLAPEMKVEVEEGKEKEERHTGMSSGLVTVVIPCYNQAHFLTEAIESVLSQTYRRFEIVVVDDGSTDETSEVASRYPQQHQHHQQVRLIRQENQGPSVARNTGIRHAKGEYLVFLDADDRLLPRALEAGVEQLEAHPECAFSSGRCDHVAVDGTPLPHTPRLHVEGDPYLALLRRCYIWPPAVVVYRRSVFEAVGGFDTSLRSAEDYEMYLRVARRFAVCHHTEVVAQYRQHEASVTRRNSPLMLSHSVGVLRSEREHLKGRGERYQEAYEAGLRWEQGKYGDPLVGEVKAQLKEGQWVRALRGVLALLRYYPRGLALLSERRMERHRLARRLRARKQELEAYEWQLKELEDDALEDSDSEGALERKRQEIQGLRRRIRRLEQRIEEIDRWVQIGLGGKIWTLFRRLGGVRVKTSRR
jgi:glycosyltransferase involved in cell wall biosynthesis